MTFNGILSFKGLFDNDDGGKGRLMEKKKSRYDILVFLRL